MKKIKIVTGLSLVLLALQSQLAIAAWGGGYPGEYPGGNTIQPSHNKQSQMSYPSTLQGAQAAMQKGTADIAGMTKDFSSSIAAYKQAVTIYKKLKNMSGLAEAYVALAGVYAQSNNEQKAIAIYQQAIPLYNGMHNQTGYIGLINSYLGLASVYENNNINNPDAATNAYNKAGSAYYNLGISYKTATNYNDAVTAFTNSAITYSKALPYYKQINQYVSNTYANIARGYNSAAEANVFAKNNNGAAVAYTNAGNMYWNGGDFSGAATAYSNAATTYSVAGIGADTQEYKTLSNQKAQAYEYAAQSYVKANNNASACNAYQNAYNFYGYAQNSSAQSTLLTSKDYKQSGCKITT